MYIKQYNLIQEIPNNELDMLISNSYLPIKDNFIELLTRAESDYYIVGYEESIPVCMLSAKLINADLSLLANIKDENTFLAIKKWYSNFMKFKIMNCKIILNKDSFNDLNKAPISLIKMISQKVDEIGSTQRADFCIIDEIPEESYELANCFANFNYKSIVGIPPKSNSLCFLNNDNSQIYLVKHFNEPAYTNVLAYMLDEWLEKPGYSPELLYDLDYGADIFYKLDLLSLRANITRNMDMYTYFPVFESSQKPIVNYRGKEIIMLGANAYLGLSVDERVKKAAKDAIDFYGIGCCGSPLLNGTMDIHQKLSRSIAEFFRKEDAIIFSTGYQTNLGVISALASKGDLLILDERDHASIYDGAMLSGAVITRYKHNDMNSLESILKKNESKSKFIIADALFSMEGTIANVPEIVRLAKKYNARIILDEAHSLGILGEGGRGVADQFGLLDQVDIITGTLSKSLGSQGGFVVSSKEVIDALKHNARAFIFSASLSPSAVAAGQASLDIIKQEPERGKKLLDNTKFLAEGLISLGYNISYEGGGIIPVYCNNEILTLSAFHKLFDEGVFVNPVLYPAVPRGKEMLRISLMSTFDKETLIKALKAFENIRTKYFPVIL